MNVKNELLNALAAPGTEYVSGAELASTLGVSRNAVWKAVKALQNEGFVIETSAAKGYKLSGSSNRFSEELIAASLTSKQLGRNIVVLDETDSTNNNAKKLASEGAVHGSVVVADKQNSGRGRLGRKFVSPSGKGIYMSVLIRPEFGIDTAPLITSAAAVAAARAVEKLSGAPVQIKWVNDLYMNGRKICGILTEASVGLEMKHLEYAVIGIGINVRSTKDCFDESLGSIATSIEDETGIALDRNELCAAVLGELEEVLGNIEERGFLEEYRRRELLTGHMITANVSGNPETGKALGIDENANLIVEFQDGSVRHLSSGEANLCRVVSEA